MVVIITIFAFSLGALGVLAANTMATDFAKPNLQERDRISLAEA